jgi:hypothetical protein
VHPIDESVHAVMNVSLRPAVKRFLCGPGAANCARTLLFLQCCHAAKLGMYMHSSSYARPHVLSGQGGLAGLALCEDCKEECAIDE